ncbi:hypothetical protein Rs2_21792 [Raphanus sativus]|nr:hypothetical protein Rs2_21792 [Raphanus sativus]
MDFYSLLYHSESVYIRRRRWRPSRRSRNHQMADEFQRAVQSSYDNGLKGQIRDRHRESTFAMETQVVKIEKSHKEASKGTPRRVRLDEDDHMSLPFSWLNHLTLKGNNFPQMV